MPKEDVPEPQTLDSAEALYQRRKAMYDRINKQVEGIERKLEDGSTGRDTAALAALIRQLRMSENDMLTAEAWVAHLRDTKPEDLSDDEYREALANAARGMVEHHLRVFVDEWCARHDFVCTPRDPEHTNWGAAIPDPLEVARHRGWGPLSGAEPTAPTKSGAEGPSTSPRAL